MKAFPAQYIVNKEHSAIKFQIPYMTMLKVDGKFTDYNISFKMEGNRVFDIHGEIKVDSITTNDKKRDYHLKDYDFFNEKKYPIIAFHSLKEIDLTKEEQVEIELTIKDRTKKIQAKLSYLGPQKDPWSESVGEYFEGQFQIKRSDFNIIWNKKMDNNEFLIGDTVSINFQIESYKSNQRPAFSRFFKERIKVSGVKEEFIPEISQSPTQIAKKNATKEQITLEEPMQKAITTVPIEIAVNVITGFITFSLCILGGIFLQSKLSNFFEKRGASSTFCYLSSSTIVMVILIIVSIFTAPVMGYGENPFLKFFK